MALGPVPPAALQPRQRQTLLQWHPAARVSGCGTAIGASPHNLQALQAQRRVVLDVDHVSVAVQRPKPLRPSRHVVGAWLDLLMHCAHFFSYVQLKGHARLLLQHWWQHRTRATCDPEI